jgi:hypothetical protein
MARNGSALIVIRYARLLMEEFRVKKPLKIIFQL